MQKTDRQNANGIVSGGMYMIQEITFIFNHKEVTVRTDPTTRLLDVVRDLLKQKGTKEGCGIGECGACSIIMNGKCVNSCVTMAAQAEGAELLTIEGLSGDTLAEIIKKCFVEEGAVQCGFCTPGMILSAYVLLQENKTPTREEIKTALSGNLCRCTGYVQIIQAIERVTREINEPESEKH